MTSANPPLPSVDRLDTWALTHDGLPVNGKVIVSHGAALIAMLLMIRNFQDTNRAPRNRISSDRRLLGRLGAALSREHSRLFPSRGVSEDHWRQVQVRIRRRQ